MNTTHQALINQIAESGISFSVVAPSPQGSEQIQLDKSLILEYLSDKNAALAKYYGVSRVHYLLWLEQERSVQCCGITLRGKRCKNIVTNGNSVTVNQWVEMQGELCEKHINGF